MKISSKKWFIISSMIDLKCLRNRWQQKSNDSNCFVNLKNNDYLYFSDIETIKYQKKDFEICYNFNFLSCLDYCCVRLYFLRNNHDVHGLRLCYDNNKNITICEFHYLSKFLN